MASVTNSSIRSRAQDVVNYNLPRVIMLHLALWAVPLAILCFSLTEISSTLYDTFTSLLYTVAVAEADTYAASAVLQLIASAWPCILLASLAGMVLNPGFLRGMQQLGSGVPVKGSVVISRWRHALGAIGLVLWIGVKTWAWGLPGDLLLSLSQLLASDGSSISGLIEFIGSVLYAVLVIPATLRYALALHVFADTPEIGVFDAVERSKQLMACRKWQLFCLTLPYALGMVAVWVIYYIVLLILMVTYSGAVTGFTAWLVVVLLLAALAATAYLSFFSTMAVACYYNAHKPQPEPETPAAQPALPSGASAEAPAQPAE